MESRVRELERLLHQAMRRIGTLESRLAASEQSQNKAGGSLGGDSSAIPRYWIGKAATAITARSGTTPGSGTAEIYDARTGTLTATGTTKTVLNAGPAISSGKHVRMDQDGFGIWWVDPEDCE